MKEEIDRISATSPWRLVPRNRSSAQFSLSNFVKSLRPTKVICQRLTPRNQCVARANTLSSRYGLGKFPAHTDFATAELPARYVVLAAPRPRHADTLIYSTQQLLDTFGEEFLRRCLFLRRGTPPRYCRIFVLVGEERLFRYNEALMEPINLEALEVADYVRSSIQTSCRVNWSENRFAIFDNWQVLHSREHCDGADGIGLIRLAIWGDR